MENRVKEQNYTSCLNFVEENNFQNEAVQLFGEDWECEEDCNQIEELLDFILGEGNHLFEVDFIEDKINEYNIKVSKNYTAEKYKLAFYEVMCYFDSISDEEQPKLIERLNKLGL